MASLDREHPKIETQGLLELIHTAYADVRSESEAFQRHWGESAAAWRLEADLSRLALVGILTSLRRKTGAMRTAAELRRELPPTMLRHDELTRTFLATSAGEFPFHLRYVAVLEGVRAVLLSMLSESE